MFTTAPIRSPPAEPPVMTSRSLRGVLLIDQILGRRDEVREGVLLRHHLPGVVPLLAEVAAAAYVRRGEDDAAVE
jgi:hypothetical protein